MMKHKITINTDSPEIQQLKNLYGDTGPIRCVKVPPSVTDPATIEHVDIAKFVNEVHNDEDNARSLAFVPLCEHRASGFWCIALFEGNAELKDADPAANIRGSLTLSMMEMAPLVVFILRV